MADEQHYATHLLSYDEVHGKLDEPESRVVEYVWRLWEMTQEIREQLKAQREGRQDD